MQRRSSRRRDNTWSLLKTSWRYQTREFFSKSTLHGVRYIAEEGRPFGERFIWFCLTLTGTMVTLIIIASLWEKFQLYPTITGLDTDFHNWEVPFPTITLCPEDPTNDSLIADFIMSTWGNVTEQQEYFVDFLKTIALFNIRDLSRILRFSEDVSQAKLPLINLEDVLFKVVNGCPDMIFDCEWKGSPYNCCEGFTTILTEVGFCFTFNSRYSRGANDNLRIADKEFKPHLIYETDSKWSILVHMTRGRFRVYIHSADEVPNQDLAPQHFWVKTINKMLFSVKHTYTTPEVRQLTVKQRHCIFPTEIPLLTGTNYTYSGCMTECRIRKAKALCDCIPFFYKELEDFPHCNLKGLACLARHQKELLQDVTCSCQLGCMNTVYEVEKLNDAVVEDDNSLEIGFVSWPMVRYKREVLFGWADLLVSFGGIAGLFLGFSLLSGVEIIYYFTMRSFCMLYRNRDDLKRLKREYDSQPRPVINLDLKPSFLQDAQNQTKKIPIKRKSQKFTVPYLN